MAGGLQKWVGFFISRENINWNIDQCSCQPTLPKISIIRVTQTDRRENPNTQYLIPNNFPQSPINFKIRAKCLAPFTYKSKLIDSLGA